MDSAFLITINNSKKTNTINRIQKVQHNIAEHHWYITNKEWPVLTECIGRGLNLMPLQKNDVKNNNYLIAQANGFAI